MSVVWQQRTHGVLRRQRQTHQMLARLFIAAVVIASLLAAAYLALIADNVRLSRETWALEHELVAMQRENQAYCTEVARWSSIPMLQERSVAMQYQPAADVEFIYMVEP